MWHMTRANIEHAFLSTVFIPIPINGPFLTIPLGDDGDWVKAAFTDTSQRHEVSYSQYQMAIYTIILNGYELNVEEVLKFQRPFCFSLVDLFRRFHSAGK